MPAPNRPIDQSAESPGFWPQPPGWAVDEAVDRLAHVEDPTSTWDDIATLAWGLVDESDAMVEVTA